MELCVWNAFSDGGMRGGVGPRHQEGMSGRHDPFGDRGDLLRRLARAENHLGKSLAGPAMVVDAGKPQVLERGLAQILKEPLVR
jgi:hypothetical protein